MNETLKWILEPWGAHICPYCGFGKGDDYIGRPYKYCPDCGKPVDPPAVPELQEGPL